MKSNSVKTILLFCLMSALANAANALSGFSQAFADIYIPDNRAALELYIGRWSGTQILLFDGNELGQGSFSQTSIARGDDENMRIVSTGLISYGKESATSRSVIFVDRENRLRTDVIGENGDVETYYGRIEKNSIYWLPKNMFMKFDYQKDSFFVSDKGVDMFCEGLRFIETPQKTGYLGTITQISKINGSFNSENVSTQKTGTFGSPQN